MVPNWVIFSIAIPCFIAVVPYIILNLWMPPWYQAWFLKVRFGVTSVTDLGAFDIDGTSFNFSNKHLLECAGPDGTTYIVQTNRQTKYGTGTGMLHTFTEVPAEDAALYRQYVHK